MWQMTTRNAPHPSNQRRLRLVSSRSWRTRTEVSNCRTRQAECLNPEPGVDCQRLQSLVVAVVFEALGPNHNSKDSVVHRVHQSVGASGRFSHCDSSDPTWYTLDGRNRRRFLLRLIPHPCRTDCNISHLRAGRRRREDARISYFLSSA